MSAESDFIAALRGFATHSAARGLADDAAVVGGLVFSHDMLVEGVHYCPDDPPDAVAWKSVAVNLSDLAAKGAEPAFALLAFTLGDAEWDRAFAEGLSIALAHFGVALIGGDTVALPPAAPRVVGMTVIGRAQARTPTRSGAQPGDALFVTGTIGDAGLGLKVAQGRSSAIDCLDAYRRPHPQLAAGAILAPLVSAIMDVSDGLLIDASRLAEASQCALHIDLDAVPLSIAYRAHVGENRDARLEAATAGDDYQLLFTSGLPLPSLPCPVTRIGSVASGAGLLLTDSLGQIALPERLGWEHN